jgi:hypothetical protein
MQLGWKLRLPLMGETPMNGGASVVMCCEYAPPLARVIRWQMPQAKQLHHHDIWRSVTNVTLFPNCLPKLLSLPAFMSHSSLSAVLATSIARATGPNTGGKTATLKTLGALALMSRAGLFWPCDPAATQQHGRPYAAHFDRVLADLGDSQSLQQNLSTFSGHIRRIKQVGCGTSCRTSLPLHYVVHKLGPTPPALGAEHADCAPQCCADATRALCDCL